MRLAGGFAASLLMTDLPSSADVVLYPHTLILRYIPYRTTATLRLRHCLIPPALLLERLSCCVVAAHPATRVDSYIRKVSPHYYRIKQVGNQCPISSC